MKLINFTAFLIILFVSSYANALQLEVGHEYFLDSAGSPRVIVLGKHGRGEVYVRYLNGIYAGRLASIYAQEFLKMEGCARKGYCVGDHFLLGDRNYTQVTIVGVGDREELVLQFPDGTLGNGWHPENLAPTQLSER